MKLKRTKFLTLVLIIALFCGSMVPVSAQEALFMLPENNANEIITEEDECSEITSVLHKKGEWETEQKTLSASENAMEESQRMQSVSENTLEEKNEIIELEEISVLENYTGYDNIQYPGEVATKLLSDDTAENVILYSSEEEREDTFKVESSFATLQEAFDEIEKIGNSSNFYQILLNNGQDGAATSSKMSLKFPKKTKGILIRSSEELQEGNLYFKGNIVLKSNVKFEDIIFRNTGKSNLSLGKFKLYLKNCYSNDNPEAVEFKLVTGNGVKNTSELILEDTILMTTGAVKNIGQVSFFSEHDQEELSASSMEEVLRVVPAFPEIAANGKINIGDVLLETDGKITGVAKITRKKGKITKIASDITINGEIVSESSEKLYLDLQEKTGESYTLLDFSAQEMETWKLEKGIRAAKAYFSKYPYVYLFRGNQSQLIKQEGYFTYYDTGTETGEDFYGVLLSFVSEGKTIEIYCHSFNDAVTEINNLKKKRDYTITLKKEVEVSSVKSPKNLKFPMKKFVNTLVIRGEKEGENLKLGYLGNLTMTSPVVLQNISFVQMTEFGGEYKRIKDVKSDYPGIVTIKTGGFDLTIEDRVDFDTPIRINGENKGSLILNGKLNTYTNDFEGGSLTGENVIYGMVENLHMLSLEDQSVSLRGVKIGRSGKKYTISNNIITNLYLEDDATLEVTGNNKNHSLTVQNLSVSNGRITVEGNGTFGNLVLSGEREAVIRVDKQFKITGTIEVKTDNARLETRRKGNKKAPYLNVSGKVIREENRNPIYVGVYYELSAGELMQEEAVKLYNAPQATAQLLTAKKAAADDFRPMEENYPGGEFTEDNTNGYVMVKKEKKIYVYSGEEYLQ